MSSQTTPPYGAYAAIMSTFVGGLAAAGLLSKALDRDPRENNALDLAEPFAVREFLADMAAGG